MAGWFDDPEVLAPPTDLPNGGFVLRSREPLQPYSRCVGEWLAAMHVGRPLCTCPARIRA